MIELAPMQKRVLAVIVKSWDATGKAPTYRVIASKLGVTLNAIAGHIARLEKKGFIWRDSGKIKLLKRSHQ